MLLDPSKPIVFFVFWLCCSFFLEDTSLEGVEQTDSIASFILPENHPIKAQLDIIFSASKVTASRKTLKDAGFKIKTNGHWSSTVVALHSKVPGYYFKLYTDDQPEANDVTILTHRILGARVAQAIIAYHGWEAYFKVPRKWLYSLPEAQKGSQKVRYVLIAEDMNIRSRESNREIWHSKKVTKEKLDILFAFLSEGGFSDSVYYFNMPFAHDGRWAVIDTEKYHTWPVPYDRLTRYLTSSMQVYWQSLIDKNGP